MRNTISPHPTGESQVLTLGWHKCCVATLNPERPDCWCLQPGPSRQCAHHWGAGMAVEEQVHRGTAETGGGARAGEDRLCVPAMFRETWILRVRRNIRSLLPRASSLRKRRQCSEEGGRSRKHVAHGPYGQASSFKVFCLLGTCSHCREHPCHWGPAAKAQRPGHLSVLCWPHLTREAPLVPNGPAPVMTVRHYIWNLWMKVKTRCPYGHPQHVGFESALRHNLLQVLGTREKCGF